MAIAAVTGLEAEARIARRAGLKAIASGGIAARTLALADSFLGDGAEALLSFGIAGALAPQLSPGALLLPRAVIADGGVRYPVDEAWRARVEKNLTAAGLHAADGDLYGANAAVDSAENKSALFRNTGAVAVDLESHLVAQAAAREGRPFLVLRAVADPASRTLPQAAVNALDEHGSPDLRRVFASVLRNPGQIVALLRLAGDTRRALLALDSALKAGPI